jgi:hypothetical protein
MYEELYAGGRAYMKPADRNRVSSVVEGWSRNPRRRPPRRKPASPPGPVGRDGQRSLF